MSWSGGKDSALALDAVRADPAVEVVSLLTSVTRGYDRVSIHGVRRGLLHAQAAALSLPLEEIELEPQSSNEQYERALAAALGRLRRRFSVFDTVVFGDLFLEDVRRYREDRLRPLGFRGSFPIWGRPTRELAEEFVDRGFAARLVCVDTTQLDARFAGRAFDRSLLADLPPSVDPCGERGEFHTFVSAGPGFAGAIPYSVGESVLREGRFMYADLVPTTPH